jgi:biotin operon repressor
VNKADKKNCISKYLKTHGLGQKNSCSRDELTSALSIDDRPLRRLISEMRKDGYPIGSDPNGKGYWYWENDKEARATINIFKGYARDIEETIRVLEESRRMMFAVPRIKQRIHKEIDGQERLVGVA